MGPWRVFQLEGSQFRVKEVSKASGSGGERVVSRGRATSPAERRATGGHRI